MGLTTAQAETEAAEVAAGEMADTVRIFSRMLSSRAAALSKNTGTTLRNLPSIGEQQPVFRCECCDDRVSAVWYVPPMTRLLEGKSKNTVAALREIHRKTFRRICDKKFHIMDLLCKPSAPALVRKSSLGRTIRPTEKGAGMAEATDRAKTVKTYGQTLYNLNKELELRGLERARTKEDATGKLREDDENQERMASYRPQPEVEAIRKWVQEQKEARVCIDCARPFLLEVRGSNRPREEDRLWIELCAVAQGKRAKYDSRNITHATMGKAKQEAKRA